MLKLLINFVLKIDRLSVKFRRQTFRQDFVNKETQFFGLFRLRN